MTKILITFGLITTIGLSIFGCSGGGDKQFSSRGGHADSSPEAAGLDSGSMAKEAIVTDGTKAKSEASDEKPLALQRKIIYTGDLHLACENLDIASQKLESRIKDFGGYIGNANKTGSRGSIREATWTIRLPAEKFDSFLKFAVSIGELQSNNRQAQDVSEEFYDVDARLKNKKIEEARLVELLRHATGKLSEILTVEKELSRVREETERIEGRLRFLRNQTDLSTITVTIQEIKNFQPEGPPNVKTQVSRTFEGSIDAMRQLGVGLLLFIVALLPWLLPILLIVWIVVRRTRKPVKEVEPTQPPEESP